MFVNGSECVRSTWKAFHARVPEQIRRKILLTVTFNNGHRNLPAAQKKENLKVQEVSFRKKYLRALVFRVVITSTLRTPLRSRVNCRQTGLLRNVIESQW